MAIWSSSCGHESIIWKVGAVRVLSLVSDSPQWPLLVLGIKIPQCPKKLFLNRPLLWKCWRDTFSTCKWGRFCPWKLVGQAGTSDLWWKDHCIFSRMQIQEVNPGATQTKLEYSRCHLYISNIKCYYWLEIKVSQPALHIQKKSLTHEE